MKEYKRLVSQGCPAVRLLFRQAKLADGRKTLHSFLRENTFMATGLTDPKMQETEGPTEDSSGKKRLKFKSLKKLFVKKKKKELITPSTKSNMKQSQSTSDVTGPEARTPDLDSDDEQSDLKSVMGIRALSHDSIFIPDTSVQQPAQPVRVFSQESVSAPIRALQLKVQQNIKLGPPPTSIQAKKMEDTGASSEDDGLPRSPPESSPIHEALARSQLAKISPGPSSRSNSPLFAVIQTRSRVRSQSPTSPLVHISSSESPASPVVDFSTPPVLSICLDNSAAKHRLAVKPRNQRSHTKRRSSSRLLSDGPSESMYNVPELTEENEQGLTKDNAGAAIPEMDPEQRAECPTTVLPQGQSLALIEPSLVMPEPFNSNEQRSDEFPLENITGHQGADIDHSNTCSEPSVPSEMAGDAMTPMEVDTLDVSATHVSTLPGTLQTASTAVTSDYSTSLDVIHPLNQGKDVSLWEAAANPAAFDTHAVHVNAFSAEEAVRATQTLTQTDIILMDHDEPSPSAPEGPESSEGESLQEDLGTCSQQAMMEPTAEEPFACSTKHVVKEKEDTMDNVPENFSSIALPLTSEVYSQPAENYSKTSKELSVSENTDGSSLEDKDAAVFQEANAKMFEEKTRSHQGSFKKNSQGSFKFSISSAWNRSRRSGAKWSGEPAAEPDVAHKTSPQKATSSPGKENQAKDEGIPPPPEPPAAKIDAHRQEKMEEAQEKDEEGRGAFGVRLRSTSHCLKYKDVSHTEHKEPPAKSHSAEVPLDSGGCPSQPNADKAEVKKPPEVSTPIDDGKLSTKSSENLAVRPPLPKKPALQSLNAPVTAMDKPKATKSVQERLKDTEKKSSGSKNSEKSVEVLQDGSCEEGSNADKGQPFTKNAQDNGSVTEDSAIPAWVTMARQKQKGYQEQYIGKEAKVPTKEVKAVTEKQEIEKEATNTPVDSKSTPSKSSTLGKPTQESRVELKPCLAEPQKKASPKTSPVTVNKHSSSTTQNTADKDGKDQHSKDKISPSSNQPSWMELAKKKAKAWSDMPQIIK
ncbi:CRACD-like protein isoform X5 [Leucoraja erinacea]|uniref:CRACD-like protein isoform X5 n=1 Tax=Leucoraja erinaceus TaxID=7782 RepID=UPI0024550171|nr:CRACD-like protein isoform X5 [Leucoraja erinacea]